MCEADVWSESEQHEERRLKFLETEDEKDKQLWACRGRHPTDYKASPLRLKKIGGKVCCGSPLRQVVLPEDVVIPKASKSPPW